MTDTEDTAKHRAPNEALNLGDSLSIELDAHRREREKMDASSQYRKAILNAQLAADGHPITGYADTDSMSEPDVVEEAKSWLKADSMALRIWIYKVAMAVLVIVAGWQGWQAVSTQDWLNLLEAVLALSGAGVANMARKNVR